MVPTLRKTVWNFLRKRKPVTPVRFHCWVCAQQKGKRGPGQTYVHPLPGTVTHSSRRCPEPRCPSAGARVRRVAGSCGGIVFSPRKEGDSGTGCESGEPEARSQVKEAAMRTRRRDSAYTRHLRSHRPADREQSGGCGAEGAGGRSCLMGTAIPSGSGQKFWRWMVGWLHNHVRGQSAAFHVVHTLPPFLISII